MSDPSNPYQFYPNAYAVYFLFPLLSVYITRFDHERLRRTDDANKHPVDGFAYFPPKWAYPVVWTVLYVLMSISIFCVYLLAYDMPEWLYFTIHITYFANFFLNKLWVWVFFDYRWYTFATGFTLTLLVLSSLYVTQCFFISSSWRYFAVAFAIPLVIWEFFVTIVVGTVASYEDSAVEKAKAMVAATESIDKKQSTIIDTLSIIANKLPGYANYLSATPTTVKNPVSSRQMKQFV